MESPILDFLKLVLRIALKIAIDACYKGPEITKFMLKEGLKRFPEYRDILALVEFVTTLILCPSKANISMEKRGFE